MLQTLVVTFVLAASIAAAATGRAADEASAYDSAKFTVGYWCGPPAGELTAERFEEIEAANFTLAFPPCGGMTVEQNRRMLDLCQEVGLKGVVSDSRMVRAITGEEDRTKLDAIVKDYSDHPALLGYHLADEPGAGAFDGLAQVVAYLRERDPRHPAYVNLLPTYGRDFGLLGTATYDEYVRTFAEKVRPFVLSYDHYAFTESGDRPDFFENLATVRQASLDRGIPFWNIVLVTQHFGYRWLTEDELRFEAMQTLAFGARGLLWFTYWMPEGVPEPQSWKHSLIAADGTRDPHYAMVRGINADVRAIGDALGRARSVAVFQHGPGATIERRSSPVVPSGGKLTIGVFEEDGGKKFALVTNRDYRQLSRTSVTVSPANATVQVFDPATKTWSRAPTADGAVPLELAAGDGVLLRW
jgi:hypothetical protein